MIARSGKLLNIFSDRRVEVSQVHQAIQDNSPTVRRVDTFQAQPTANSVNWNVYYINYLTFKREAALFSMISVFHVVHIDLFSYTFVVILINRMHSETGLALYVFIAKYLLHLSLTVSRVNSLDNGNMNTSFRREVTTHPPNNTLHWWRIRFSALGGILGYMDNTAIKRRVAEETSYQTCITLHRTRVTKRRKSDKCVQNIKNIAFNSLTFNRCA